MSHLLVSTAVAPKSSAASSVPTLGAMDGPAVRGSVEPYGSVEVSGGAMPVLEPSPAALDAVGAAERLPPTTPGASHATVTTPPTTPNAINVVRIGRTV